MATSEETLVQAKNAFHCVIDGLPVVVRKGDLVRIGHAVLEGRDHLFSSLVVNFEHHAPPPKPVK